MGSVNKVIIVGYLGNEPETRYTANGTAMTTISIATNEYWQDKQTGQRQEHTDWHRVVFFGRQAEVVKQYLHKGSQIYVEGRLQTRKWQDQNTGQDRYTTEILAREMQMLDKRGETGSANYAAPSSGNYPPYAQPGASGGYSAPPPANQGMGQPIPQPPYPNEGMGQPSSQSPTANENVGQPTPPSSAATGSSPPSPDKDFDQDVPF